MKICRTSFGSRQGESIERNKIRDRAKCLRLLSNVALAAGHRPALHGLMAALALKVERVFQREHALIGFLFMTGIARLPLSAPVIQVCVKIMMTPGAVQLVFRVKLVIELDHGPLVLSDFRVIKQD
jgi:hypothetical protein